MWSIPVLFHKLIDLQFSDDDFQREPSLVEVLRSESTVSDDEIRLSLAVASRVPLPHTPRMPETELYPFGWLPANRLTARSVLRALEGNESRELIPEEIEYYFRPIDRSDYYSE